VISNRTDWEFVLADARKVHRKRLVGRSEEGRTHRGDAYRINPEMVKPGTLWTLHFLVSVRLGDADGSGGTRLIPGLAHDGMTKQFGRIRIQI
jgi:hypothetical protein